MFQPVPITWSTLICTPAPHSLITLPVYITTCCLRKRASDEVKLPVRAVFFFFLIFMLLTACICLCHNFSNILFCLHSVIYYHFFIFTSICPLDTESSTLSSCGPGYFLLLTPLGHTDMKIVMKRQGQRILLERRTGSIWSGRCDVESLASFNLLSASKCCWGLYST